MQKLGDTEYIRGLLNRNERLKGLSKKQQLLFPKICWNCQKAASFSLQLTSKGKVEMTFSIKICFLKLKLRKTWVKSKAKI